MLQKTKGVYESLSQNDFYKFKYGGSLIIFMNWIEMCREMDITDSSKVWKTKVLHETIA